MKIKTMMNCESNKKKILCSAISASLLAVSAPTVAQSDTSIEEVVVTGSLIRRSEGFAAASPLTTYDAEELDAQGTINMGEVVMNSVFNLGSGIANTTQGTSDNNTSFNLRGLGSSATLTLVDGKRTPTDNVQVLLPSLAIQRVEILKDGAAALYGTDAVSGVVNFIPYTVYDGFEMELFTEGDSRGDYNDTQLQAIGGTEIGALSVVVAASHKDQGELWRIDRPDNNLAGLNQSPNSNPGNFLVPDRDENGQLTGSTTRLADPSCGETRAEDPAQLGANPYGFMFAGRCWMDNGDTRNYRNAQTKSMLYGNLAYDVSRDLNLEAQFNYARQLITPRLSPSNPGGRTELLPTIRGELPGNPYRAVSGDGRELYAQPLLDSDGNMVVDHFGRPLPLRNDNNQVVLASNQFASLDSDPSGGVPFYEDVEISSWRPFGGPADTMPAQNNPDTSTAGDWDRRYFRTALSAEYTLPFAPDWNGSTVYTYMTNQDKDLVSNSFSLFALQQGLNCDVVNDRESCFNPFGVTDDRFYTPQAVADSIVTMDRENNLSVLQTFDTVFTGALPLGEFTLPGGDIQAAFGYQRREETRKERPAANIVKGDVFIGTQEDPRTNSRYSNSWYTELLFPVLSNLEVSAAARNESFSSSQEDTVAKFGVIYEPFDWIAFRGTWGEAFIAPTLNQLYSPQVCGLTNVEDPFTTFSGFAAGCRSGNADLVSETSETTSFGIDLIPFNDLNINISWSETDFKDRIVNSSTNDILALDFFNFKQATGYTSQPGELPSVDLVSQWVADPRSDKRIIRQSDDVTRVQRVISSSTNASKMLVRSWDMNLDYSTDLANLGVLGFKLQAVYMDDYTYQFSADREVIDAVGNQNGRTGAVPAIPELKANARLSWSYGSHRVNLIGRYTGEVKYDNTDFSFQRFFPFSRYEYSDVIRAWTTADIGYTYSDYSLPGDLGSVSVTAGARNLFDRMPQKVGTSEGFVPELQDILGRVVYLRLNYQF